MVLQMGERELELGGPYLGELREATSLMGDDDALRQRLAEDGYLFIRGLHDPERVLSARRAVLENLEANGQLAPHHRLLDGYIAEGARGAFMGGARAVRQLPALLDVVEAPELMRFFTNLLGGEAMTFDYKWIRAVGHGQNTGAHYDVVYMGRGTTDLYTCWTPLGEVSYEHGPLAILAGSHTWEKVKETYGRMDVDRDRVEGHFSKDPIELVETFGGRWLTARFNPGDAMVFGMFTMHGSLNNNTNRFRISMDTRYQRADEPYDERWVGDDPQAHSESQGVKPEAIAAARQRWGV